MHRRTLLGAALAAGSLTLAGGMPAYAARAVARTGSLPPLDKAALDAVLDPLDPTLSAALAQVRGSAGCWQGRAGVADLRTRRPAPWDARFRIGSITKAFTATAVFQLAAAGLVDLDAPLRRYLPERLPASYPGTVRQALNHTSGLQGIRVDHKDPAWFRANRFVTYRPGSQVRWAEPSPFEPGGCQQYGNAGYIAAGLVIERVTGRPYADAIRRGILRPLRLRHTSLPGTRVAIPGPHVRGYEQVAHGFEDVTRANPSLQWAAAEMISTTADLDRFLVGLLGGRLLDARWLDQLLTVPGVKTYVPGREQGGADAAHCCGLTRLPVGDLEVWGKSGDRPGYNSAMGATRDLRRRLVLSVNPLRMGGEQPAVAERLIRAALTRSEQVSEFRSR